jgi:hypothetical protein
MRTAVRQLRNKTQGVTEKKRTPWYLTKILRCFEEFLSGSETADDQQIVVQAGG